MGGVPGWVTHESISSGRCLLRSSPKVSRSPVLGAISVAILSRAISILGHSQAEALFLSLLPHRLDSGEISSPWFLLRSFDSWNKALGPIAGCSFGFATLVCVAICPYSVDCLTRERVWLFIGHNCFSFDRVERAWFSVGNSWLDMLGNSVFTGC